jgi:prepilin-type N-terminal cleavage/methylation domain-containing protein
MSRRQLSNNGKRAGAPGFSLIEVVIAITILSIGLLSVALLVSGTLSSGTRARYMNMANVLASEKLDGLNKLPSTDPNIFCTTTCGALTGPSICLSTDIYCDQVTVAEASGADFETQTQTVNGNPVTTTIVHTSAGCVDTPTNCSVATPSSSASAFTRRWLITVNPTITSTAGSPATATGLKRVTVVVSLDNAPATAPVNFQMSMVRP